MSQRHNTEYAGNQAASQFHRVIGKNIYAADLDMIEYTYKNGKIKPVAVLDWKYPGEKVGSKYSAIQLQQVVADKLQVPFFVVITYLDDNYPVKMLFVIPGDDNARAYFTRCRLSREGAWMSLQTFSKFQHALRSLKWNPEEEILNDNLLSVGLKAGMKLKDLSQSICKYELPKREF